jgi:hypothetical protein
MSDECRGASVEGRVKDRPDQSDLTDLAAFQGLEIFSGVFPSIGRFHVQLFQALEKFATFSPNLGNLTAAL